MSSQLFRGLGDDAATRHRTPVPEPSTLAPLGAGVLSLCALRWPAFRAVSDLNEVSFTYTRTIRSIR